MSSPGKSDVTYKSIDIVYKLNIVQRALLPVKISHGSGDLRFSYPWFSLKILYLLCGEKILQLSGDHHAR